MGWCADVILVIFFCCQQNFRIKVLQRFCVGLCHKKEFVIGFPHFQSFCSIGFLLSKKAKQWLRCCFVQSAPLAVSFFSFVLWKLWELVSFCCQKSWKRKKLRISGKEKQNTIPNCHCCSLRREKKNKTVSFSFFWAKLLWWRDNGLKYIPKVQHSLY